MTDPTYRYVLADLLTDRTLAVLPLSGVSFDRRISRVGSFTGQLDVATDDQLRLARLCKAYAGRSALYALRDGQPWWGGIPWTVQLSQGPRDNVQCSITAATFDSYAAHRLLRSDLTYTQVDQGVIIPDMWRKLQADPRGNIKVVALDQPTGVLRDRVYLAADQPYYGKLVEDLGDVEGGPEHTIDVYLDDAGNRVKRLRVANRLGATGASVVFSRATRGGGGVLSWAETADAVDGGTVFQTRGDAASSNVGEEQTALLSDVLYADDLLAAGWPLLDVVADYSDVSEKATLDGYARALRATNAGALTDETYTVRVGATGWNPNRLGEPVRMKLADAWHTPALDSVERPVACKVTPVGRGGSESIDLTFGDSDT